MQAKLDRWLEHLRICPLCGGSRWKRVVEDSNVLVGCEGCRCYEVDGEVSARVS